MRRILQITWLLPACIASEPLKLPIDSTEGSVLFAIREGTEKPRIFAYPPHSVPPLAIGPEDLFLISYPVDLEDLGLAPGEQPRPGDSDPARPFPPGYTAYRSSEGRDEWMMLAPDELEEELGARVLSDIAQCEGSRGCIRRREQSDHQYCEMPCQEPPDPTPPMEPLPPALPDFGPCPAGWLSRQSLAADATYCEPVALEGCQAGSAHFLGDAGCARVGASCPADGWPAVLPPGATVHFVRSGSSGDGTSKASPFGTIAQALAAAAPLDVIALYAAQHAGGVVLDRSLAIRGACSDTVISGGSPAIQIEAGAVVEISDLTIEPAGDGFDVRGNATLAGVTIVGAAHGAVVGGALFARELLIRDSREGGLLGAGQGELRIRRGIFADNVSHGVRIGDQARARLEDIIVRGSLAHSSGEFDRRGYGTLALSGRLVVTRALFERNRANAISAWYTSTASVTHAVDRDGLGGYSLDLDNGAIGEASFLVTLRSIAGSVWTFRTGEATVKDVYVQRSGGGLFARLGGRLVAERALLEDNSGVGVESSGTSNITLTDIIIRDQTMNGSDTGQGILIDDASLNADRVQIIRASG